MRHLIARNASELSQSVGERPGRAEGETLALEVLPLADACRFLEREAEALLAPKRLGSKGRPLWLSGASAEIRREPLGVILIVAPSNYPLFLPGVQIVQALAAGNAVLIKPAPGCVEPMRALLGLLEDAGLPAGLCVLLDETVEAGREAIAAGVDKLVLTGSAETGRRVLADLAPHLTPAVMELSGNDAVFVLPGADLDLTAKALAYGLRLNGGATCIAPRRVFADRGCALELERRLTPLALALPPVAVPERIRTQVARLLDEAEYAGCRLIGPRFRADEPRMAPVIVADAVPELGLLREDIFAPVLSLVPVAGEADALNAAAQCPYALGASIFGPEPLAPLPRRPRPRRIGHHQRPDRPDRRPPPALRRPGRQRLRHDAGSGRAAGDDRGQDGHDPERPLPPALRPGDADRHRHDARLHRGGPRRGCALAGGEAAGQGADGTGTQISTTHHQ